WHLAMLHGDARSLGLAAYGVPLGSTVLLVATGYAEWGWHLIAGGTLIVAPALCVTLRARRLPEQEAGAAPQARW
ncbi:MAG: hypothetical protein KDE27_24725, partial [Planctomycetes bacterium]|nr:hypothetical protein [Planctomycetota bacterium]